MQLARVIGIKPSKNFQTVDITAQWHDDTWYLWAYGQGLDPYLSGTGKQAVNRPPFGWQPFIVHPIPGDPIYSPSEFTFDLYQIYETAADGTGIAKLRINGRMPVNSFGSLHPPLLALQGNTANVGGQIAGGLVYYAVVCSFDDTTPNALTSAPSKIPCSTYIPAGTNTNTLVIPILGWPTGVTGYRVFAGPNPNTLTYQAGGVGTPATIEIDSIGVRNFGQPDLKFDHFEFAVKRVVHSGLFSQTVSAILGGLHPLTVQFDGLPADWTPGQWAGYSCSIIAHNPTVARVPFWNFLIDSNGTDTLTFSSASTDLGTLGATVGDLLVIRFRPDTISPTTIGDSQFTGLSDEKGFSVRIIAGPGRGQVRTIASNTGGGVYSIDTPWDTLPTAASVFVVEEQLWHTIPDTPAIVNADFSGFFTTDIEVTNYQGQVLLVQARTVDVDGVTSFDQDCPLREVYLWGQTLSSTVLDDLSYQKAYL